MLKQMAAQLLASPPGRLGLAIGERFIHRRPNHLQVLTYHRLGPVELFEAHMAHLASNYVVVSVEDVLAACTGKRPFPPRAVLITFDDAYKDFAGKAWPILQKYELPVTLFVPTAFPDSPTLYFWWDHLQQAFLHTSRRDSLQTEVGTLSMASAQARNKSCKVARDFVKTLPHAQALEWVSRLCEHLGVAAAKNDVLGWDELRTLAQAGVTLGAHTRSHPIMTQLPLEEALDEATASLEDLRREIGGDVPAIFAYPSGIYEPQIVEGLRQRGFLLAFTTERGNNALGAS